MYMVITEWYSVTEQEMCEFRETWRGEDPLCCCIDDLAHHLSSGLIPSANLQRAEDNVNILMLKAGVVEKNISFRAFVAHYMDHIDPTMLKSFL